MQINTIALDLDGTLVDSSQEIQKKTKEALLYLESQGLRLILVSGRPINSMLKFARELALDKQGGIILANNGGVAYQLDREEVLFSSPMDSQLLRKLLESMEGKPIDPIIEDGEYMLVEDVYRGVIDTPQGPVNRIQHEARIGGYLLKEVRPLSQIAHKKVNKVLAIVNPPIMDRMLEEFQAAFGDRLAVNKSAPSHIQFTDPAVSKANGLKRLGVDPTTLLAFGDSLNDLEMLAFAKLSVAMGNAEPEVKKLASYTTTSEDEEGIYQALVHFGLVDPARIQERMDQAKSSL